MAPMTCRYASGAVLARWLMTAVISCANASANPAPTTADDLLVVDCLLPGQIRQLARNTTYLSARRPVKTTALDCRVRNGEYVVEDRASLSTALKVWLAVAESGDPEAQTTVGEIFERGLGVPPDHEAAAQWYRRAAEAGYARAQINLGNLYEKGLGVTADSRVALTWYRRAAGLNAEIAIDTTPDVAPLRAADAAERAKLKRDLEQLAREMHTLRAELEAARVADLSPKADVASPVLGAETQSLVREVQSLAEIVAAREADIRSLTGELERTRTDLLAQIDAAAHAQAAAQAQEQAAQTSGDAERLARKEADLRNSELKQALTLLADRERTLAQRAQETEALRSRIQTIESREQVALNTPRAPDVAQGLLAGPEITLIDPILPRTRGLIKVSIPTTLQRRRIIGRVTAPAGLVSVSVNDTPASPNAAGIFSVDLVVPQTESRVSLLAIDSQGKRADVNFVLTPSGAGEAAVVATIMSNMGPSTPRIDFGRYYALLIGNETYDHLPQLNTPGADVETLDAVLRGRFGFETRVLRDASRYEILSALNDVRSKLTSADNLLLYYAGHGELDEVNMRGHWLPIDAEPNSSANWISNVSITDILNVIKAKQILLIVDSCYSGTLTRSTIASQDTAQTEAERLTWLNLMASKRARVVLTSGGLAPVLDAGGGRHSVFAKALIETLEETREITEGQALYRAIAARVAHAAAGFEFEQTPQFAPIAHAGHESGDFFLQPTL